MKSTSLNLHGFITVFISSLVFGLCMSCSLGGALGNSSTASNPSAPAAPGGVTLTGTSCTKLSVNWTPVSGATSYTVYYTDDGTTPTANANSGYFDSISAPPYVFIPDTYQNGDQIQVVVSATNAAGEGAVSGIASGTALVPANVQVSINNATSKTKTLKITWTAVAGTPAPQSYMVYKSSASSITGLSAPTYNTTDTGNNPSGTTEYWDCGILTNYYEFVVAGVDGSGNIGPLSVVSTPVQPN